MNKKTIAIILEALPPIAAVLLYLMIFAIDAGDSAVFRWVAIIADVLAFFGFVFFFIGRKLAKSGGNSAEDVGRDSATAATDGSSAEDADRAGSAADKAVRILGILDWIATASVIFLYTGVAFLFGL